MPASVSSVKMSAGIGIGSPGLVVPGYLHVDIIVIRLPEAMLYMIQSSSARLAPVLDCIAAAVPGAMPSSTRFGFRKILKI